MARQSTVNWLAIRTAYVVKGMSAQQCADEFKIDRATIARRASKEGWTAERHSNVTAGSDVVTNEMREVVASIAAGHVAAADQQVRLAQAVADKLEEAIAKVDPRDIRTLRSIIEAGARLGEWTDKGISSSRASRGLRPGEASDGQSGGTEVFTYEWVEAPRPAEELSPAESQTA